MEIDEHLKYTLYVHSCLRAFYPTLLTPLPASNLTHAPERANRWSHAERRITSCKRQTRIWQERAVHSCDIAGA